MTGLKKIQKKLFFSLCVGVFLSSCSDICANDRRSVGKDSAARSLGAFVTGAAFSYDFSSVEKLSKTKLLLSSLGVDRVLFDSLYQISSPKNRQCLSLGSAAGALPNMVTRTWSLAKLCGKAYRHEAVGVRGYLQGIASAQSLYRQLRIMKQFVRGKQQSLSPKKNRFLFAKSIVSLLPATAITAWELVELCQNVYLRKKVGLFGYFYGIDSAKRLYEQYVDCWDFCKNKP